MNPDRRRNACPTIAAPMETGDGLLARLPPSRPLSAATLRAITDAARRFGNGILEVTARGSLQVRGLSPETAAPFAAALAEAGISDTRPAIHVPPLARGEAIAGLAEALRPAIARAGLGPRLAAKTAVIIDGPAPCHLDELTADLRLVVSADDVTFAVGGTAATARSLGRVPRDRAVAAAITVLDRLAQHGLGARGRDLDPQAVAPIIGSLPAPAMKRRPSVEALGIHDLGAGRVAIGIALPFGQVEAATLDALADAAADLGATQFETTVGRVLLAIGIAAKAADDFRRRSAALGFIVDPADPRRAIAACPGAPACGAAHMPARAIANAVSAAAAPILDGTVALHLSGCPKGCAHPRAATLALVGTEVGLALAVNGRAIDAAPSALPETDLVAMVARLAARVAADRTPGETAADTITRLGAARLAATPRPEPIDA